MDSEIMRERLASFEQDLIKMLFYCGAKFGKNRRLTNELWRLGHHLKLSQMLLSEQMEKDE